MRYQNLTRVRLYKRADTISDAEKQRKLEREYNLADSLKRFIYWTDIGREGAKHFKQQMKQKQMAESVAKSMGGSISVEKTQKMIRKAIEAQEKADSTRARINSRRTPNYSQSGRRSNSRGRGRPFYQQNRSPRPQPARSGRPSSRAPSRRPSNGRATPKGRSNSNNRA